MGRPARGSGNEPREDESGSREGERGENALPVEVHHADAVGGRGEPCAQGLLEPVHCLAKVLRAGQQQGRGSTTRAGAVQHLRLRQRSQCHSLL